MGLLNQIVGGLAGNLFGSSRGRSLGGGNSRLVMTLLPVLLGVLANRQRGGREGMGLAGGMGGMGGLAGMGGLGGLLQQFTQKGYGRQAESWVSTGENEPLSPDALSDVLGEREISEIAAQAGVSEDEARTGLSDLIPEVVDHFTPDGRLPDDDQLLSGIDEYRQRLPR